MSCVLRSYKLQLRTQLWLPKLHLRSGIGMKDRWLWQWPQAVWHPSWMLSFIYNKGQGQSQGQGMQQPRIDFRMVLPTQWGLEQFLKMTQVLKQIEDKYTNLRPYNSQQRQNNVSTGAATSQNKENQTPDESTQMTSWPSQITKSTQIGNISVKQLATSLGKEIDHITEALEEVFGTPTSDKNLECQVVEPQWLVAGYDPDNYYVDLESSSSCRNHFNDVCVLTLGRQTGITFPVTINPKLQINALYDTGASRSCMSYETFFSLGLELDNRILPWLCIASGTDVGARGFAMLSFHINNHPFIQQFIVCCRQTRNPILGQDFSICNCAGCYWTSWGTKRFTIKGKLILERD